MCTTDNAFSTAIAVDRLDARVQDVETVWVLAAALVLAAPGSRLDPQHLPPLPSRGLIRQERSAVALETLRGVPLGRLAGFHLASRLGLHGALLEGRRGRLYVVDVVQRRVRRASSMDVPGPAGCHFTDATGSTRLFVCGRTIRRIVGGRSSVVARAPSPDGGQWQWAEWERRSGRAILAQWLGECESPTAFAIVGGKARPYGARAFGHAPESFALGWLPDGRALVHFPAAACGRGHGGPGVYAIPLRGRAQLLRRLPAARPTLLEMWGG